MFTTPERLNALPSTRSWKDTDSTADLEKRSAALNDVVAGTEMILEVSSRKQLEEITKRLRDELGAEVFLSMAAEALPAVAPDGFVVSAYVTPPGFSAGDTARAAFKGGAGAIGWSARLRRDA